MLDYTPADNEIVKYPNGLQKKEALAKITALWHCAAHRYNYARVVWFFRLSDIPVEFREGLNIPLEAMVPSEQKESEQDIIFACSILKK